MTSNNNLGESFSIQSVLLARPMNIQENYASNSTVKDGLSQFCNGSFRNENQRDEYVSTKMSVKEMFQIPGMHESLNQDLAFRSNEGPMMPHKLARKQLIANTNHSITELLNMENRQPAESNFMMRSYHARDEVNPSIFKSQKKSKPSQRKDHSPRTPHVNKTQQNYYMQNRDRSKSKRKEEVHDISRRSFTPLGCSSKRPKSRPPTSQLTSPKPSARQCKDQQSSKKLPQDKSSAYYSPMSHLKSSVMSSSKQPPSKEIKVPLDYFLGTAKVIKQHKKQVLKEKLTNIIQLVLDHITNGKIIIENLKVIFVEYSSYIEGGSMGSTVQPVNQNMMTLYTFHQFMKAYKLVFDHTSSHNFEMIFVQVRNQQNKKIDFLQFGTVLAKMGLKIFYPESEPDQVDPLEVFIRFINEFLFSVLDLETTKERYNRRSCSPHQSVSRDASPSQAMPSDNEFEKYRIEFETSGAARIVSKDQKYLEAIFSDYSKSSQSGASAISLRVFKTIMRDLSVIPHITSEYKCAQLYKYLGSKRRAGPDLHQEDIMTFNLFVVSLYILFSLTIADEDDTRSKVMFMLKWMREHAKEKVSASNVRKEENRLMMQQKLYR